MGLIIGKKGETIQRVQKATGAHVVRVRVRARVRVRVWVRVRVRANFQDLHNMVLMPWVGDTIHQDIQPNVIRSE